MVPCEYIFPVLQRLLHEKSKDIVPCTHSKRVPSKLMVRGHDNERQIKTTRSKGEHTERRKYRVGVGLAVKIECLLVFPFIEKT